RARLGCVLLEDADWRGASSRGHTLAGRDRPDQNSGQVRTQSDQTIPDIAAQCQDYRGGHSDRHAARPETARGPCRLLILRPAIRNLPLEGRKQGPGTGRSYCSKTGGGLVEFGICLREVAASFSAKLRPLHCPRLLLHLRRKLWT